MDPQESSDSEIGEQEYDVFLAHNSADKPIVRSIRDQLLGRGIQGWLDEDDGEFGRHTSDALDRGIALSACCVFLVGRGGLGRWQKEEVAQAAQQAVDKGKRFAAVLLPGYEGEITDLPSSLAVRTGLDLRRHFNGETLTPAGLNRLVRAIQGPMPTSRRQDSNGADKKAPGGAYSQVQSNQQVALLFAPADPAAPQALNTWLRDIPLKNRVARRTFTPFVGYGAVQSGPPADDPSQADCLKWDSRLTRLVEQGADADKLSGFLDRVVEQRVDGRSLIGHDERREPITNLRYACLRLAYTATLVLVDVWHKRPSPVCDWHLHDITLDEAGIDSVRLALGECVDRCEDVDRMQGADPELLGLGGLTARFVATRTELESAVLSGTLVEWFTDVFWHVMTFDSAVYPRIGELTTQVSLMMGSAEPRKHLIPISRVQRGDYRILVEAVQKSLGRGVAPADVSAARRAFLARLAEVSHVTHEEWDRRIQSNDPARRGPTSTPQPAILLTTTLGLDLEFALATGYPGIRNSVFHVAVPVIVDYGLPGARHGRVAVRWLVGDFPVSDTPDRSSITRPDGGRWRWLQHWGTGGMGIGWPALRGPLLLKLGGSPLHDLSSSLLPKMDEDERREMDYHQVPAGSDVEREVAHAVTLDEFDVIQRTAFELVEMGEQIGSGDRVRLLPRWLRLSINSPGRWWIYLGPRLTDWNSRLEFVLNRILMAPDSRSERPVLIGRNIRPDHTRS